MRLDKYLKISRLIKRRTVANEACDNGRVTLNGRIARASAEVKPGDIIGISFGNRETRVEVLTVQENLSSFAGTFSFGGGGGSLKCFREFRHRSLQLRRSTGILNSF